MQEIDLPLYNIKSSFSQRWRQRNGYLQVLKVAFPLILSTGSWSVQQFIDRMFLSWYSPDALAAALPTGMLCFTLISLFMGTSGYVSTFVAQYIGASRPERVGPAMWQGIYFSVLGGLLIAFTALFPKTIFSLIGHSPEVQILESEYWVYLTLGGIFPVAQGAVAGFFSGRGKTYPIMWSTFAATAVNIALNYLLIFGNLGMPEMGISGAGLSTFISGILNFLILSILVFSNENNSKYKTRSGWKYEPALFRRLIRYGLPNGIQFFLDIAAFSLFILLIGRLGATELAAASIAFNVSMLSFMPMIGLGITVSILVGQSLGANESLQAKIGTFSALQISFTYMTILAIIILLIPNLFIYPFSVKADPIEFESIKSTALVALRFIALWSIFDSLAIIFSSALKGAGDTAFIMLTICITGPIVLIVPTYLIIEIFHLGLNAAWISGVAYVLCLGIVYYLRFKGGKWESMRVIETQQAT